MSYRVKMLAVVVALFMIQMGVHDYFYQKQREEEMHRFAEASIAKIEATHEAYERAAQNIPQGIKLNDLPSCSQKVFFLPIPKDGSVWTVVSDQVWKNYPDKTLREHEREVLDLVNFMQSQIDLTPPQTIKDLEVVPVGYVIAMTADNGIFLPGEVANK